MPKIPKSILLFVFTLAAILVPRIAHVSHANKDITLSEVVAQSDWICVTEYLGPDKEISAGYRFKTIETLLNKMSKKQPPEKFVVVTPIAIANATVRKVHKTTGVRRIPLIYRLAEGAGFPGKPGEKLIVFLKEHDQKVLALTAANATLPLDKREQVTKLISKQKKKPEDPEPADLILIGKVVSIEIVPLAKSRNNFVVKTKVVKVTKGSFDGSHFSFRIHSPSKSQIAVGKQLEVRAKRVPEGYFVDPIQFIGR
jgi:hypothetical protein